MAKWEFSFKSVIAFRMRPLTIPASMPPDWKPRRMGSSLTGPPLNLRIEHGLAHVVADKISKGKPHRLSHRNGKWVLQIEE